MAHEAGVLPLHEEAIWAICTSFSRKRTQSCAITLEQGKDNWWLIEIPLLQGTDDPSPSWSIILCLIEASQEYSQRVLSFRFTTEQERERACTLTLYDAIIA